MDRFTTWYLDEVFTPPMIRAEEILQRYCDLHLEDLLCSLRLDTRLAQPRTAESVAAELGYHETADVTLHAMLSRLAARTAYVEQTGDRFVAVGRPLPGTEERLRLRREMSELGSPYLAALDFLDFGAEHFEAALGDDPDLLDRMLSGRSGGEIAELWDRSTNTDPLQDCHGLIGARALLELFDGGTILEIGGGTGNGLRHVLAAFSEAGVLHRLESYVFTDISVGFINTTRRKVSKEHPEAPLRWQFLDLNKDLAEQKINESSVDLIYAVNSAHVAKDIVAFLRSCRRALVPGGRVLFSERVRLRPGEMAPRELTLNLSPYHRGAAQRNADSRPDHSYLSTSHWLRCFELAGLDEGTILPDFDALADVLPNRYAAVATAVKTGTAPRRGAGAKIQELS